MIQKLLRKDFSQHHLVMLRELIISSVLPHYNKNLKQRTRGTVLGQTDQFHSSWLQLCVTTQFHLENKGKYILEA